MPAGTVLFVSTDSAHPLLKRLGVCEWIDGTKEASRLVALIQEAQPGVVVVDTHSLGEENALALIEALRVNESDTPFPILAMTAGDESLAERALRAGANDFFCGDPLDAHVAARVALHRRPGDSAPNRNGERHSGGRVAEQIFRNYAEFSKHFADGMVVIEPSGKVLFASPKARELFRVGDEPDINVKDFLAADESTRAKELVRGFSRGEFPKNVDFRVFSGEREAIVNVNFSASLEDDGAVLFTFRDVTKERETERELTKAREFLERVIESSVDAIVAADLSGQVLLFNRAAGRIFGYPPEQVVRRMNVEQLYPPGVAREVMRQIRDQAHGGAGRVEGFNVNMQDSYGHEVPVRISAALIYEDGKPSGSVGIFRDIREELRMAARLKEAQETVRHHEKEVAVAQLAGATAHELNQPLTVVIAYAELLSMRLQQGCQLWDAARIISEQAERMANIVRQVGKITRYETKSYVGSAQILDLEKSSDNSE